MSYSSDSLTDRLAAVREAINRCLTSQRYSIGNRSQQAAELRDLRALEKDLQREIQESGNSGQMCSLGRIDRAT